MRRVLGIGVALGLAAALVSRCGTDDEFCDLADGNGLVAGKAASRHDRVQYRERLDDAARTAPGSLADEVDALRDAADPPGGAAAARSPKLADERSSVDDWVGENCP